MPSRLRSAVMALVFALVLVTPAFAHAQESQVPHTPADARFMQAMMHHHAQAVTMAMLVPTRTSRQDLRMLAQRIDVSQVDEINWMGNWLKDRGETAPDVLAGAGPDAHTGHAMTQGVPKPGMPMPAMMPGMLTADEMAALERATGAEFERLFLSGMIRHHEGAIVMVRELFASPGAGQEPMIFGFASDVDADQRAEIARMRKLLVALGPG